MVFVSIKTQNKTKAKKIDDLTNEVKPWELKSVSFGLLPSLYLAMEMVSMYLVEFSKYSVKGM